MCFTSHSPPHSLPTFFPGYAAHSIAKHTKRGYTGIALGAVLVIIAVVVAMSGSRRRRSALRSFALARVSTRVTSASDDDRGALRIRSMGR